MRDKTIRDLDYPKDTALFSAAPVYWRDGRAQRRWHIEQFSVVNDYGITAARDMHSWLGRFLDEVDSYTKPDSKVKS